VEAAARDGADLGYSVIVLADCCETVNDEMQRFAIDVILALIAQVSDTSEFEAALKIAQAETTSFGIASTKRRMRSPPGLQESTADDRPGLPDDERHIPLC
jgi:hypothetical protein